MRKMELVKEVEIKVGKGGLPARLVVIEEPRREVAKIYDVVLYDVEHPLRKVIFSIGEFEREISKKDVTKQGLKISLFLKKNREKLEKSLSELLGKKFSLPKQKEGIIFSLEESEREKIERLLSEVEKFNEEQIKRAFSYPTKLIVVERPIYDYLMPVFEWNKPDKLVEEDLRRRFENLKKFVKKADRLLVLGDELKAPEDLIGQTLTLEEVEKLYRDAIEKGKEILRKEKEEKEKKIRELEERRKRAIEEAKRTGKEVVIRTVYAFDADNPNPDDRLLFGDLIKELKRKYGEELGVVEIVEVATPNGEILEKAIPSF